MADVASIEEDIKQYREQVSPSFKISSSVAVLIL
jgi:hypothetical protein